jgi:hypothetical protein
VTAHVDLVRLRQGRDLAPRGDAADPGEIENDDIDRARVEERAKRLQV